jgi:hypothetical protein
MPLDIVPCTLREARAFVAAHHRHHRPPQGGLFAVAAACPERGGIVGVAIVGRPVARLLGADDFTAEVTRCCVLRERVPLAAVGASEEERLERGVKDACSALYAAAWRAARALGYRRLITYTLASESGASLRGAGWRVVGESRGGPRARPSRPRVDLHPLQQKLRWEAGEGGASC